MDKQSHTVDQKTRQMIFDHNKVKCRLIFKIPPLAVTKILQALVKWS